MAGTASLVDAPLRFGCVEISPASGCRVLVGSLLAQGVWALGLLVAGASAAGGG